MARRSGTGVHRTSFEIKKFDQLKPANVFVFAATDAACTRAAGVEAK